MAFSKEWDIRYRENTHMSIWPWSDLVSYVKRYAATQKRAFRVLELGCGAGANIPFFKHLGADYYAIEGSQFIVGKLKKRFSWCRDKIVAGDFTEKIPFSVKFDLIVDRASLTHAPSSGIRRGVKLVHKALKPRGKFIGIDWFSTIHSDYKKGIPGEDKYTRAAIQNGQFENVGCVHFTDKRHLQDLFKGFKIEVLEHKIVKREIPSNNHIFASWNFLALKGV